MKITKFEKFWLAATVLFYALYNLPGVPAYGDAKAAILHGLLTVVPIWILAYAGMVKINKIYTLREDENEQEDGK